jgi:hypothetical protein
VETCPTKVRVFGDINDPNSEVSRLLAKYPSRVLKPAQGTKPHLFYLIDGEAMLAILKHRPNSRLWFSLLGIGMIGRSGWSTSCSRGTPVYNVTGNLGILISTYVFWSFQHRSLPDFEPGACSASKSSVHRRRILLAI